MILTRTLRRLAVAASLLGSLSPMVASADTTIAPVTVTSVGVQGTQIYIFSPDLPLSCNNIAYLAVSSGFAEYVMSLALTAKATGTRLSRIDINQETPCTITLLQW